VARLQVRHSDPLMLEKLKGMPLALDRKLGAEVAVKASPDFNGALSGKGDFGSKKVQGGVSTPVFFALAIDEKLPDAVKPGDLLLGTVSYGEPAVKAAGKMSRGGFSVQYAVAVGKYEEKKEEEKEEDKRGSDEKLKEAVRDATIKHLEGLRKWESRDAHDTLLCEMLGSYPKHLPVHAEAVKAALEIKDPELKGDAAAYAELVAASKAIKAVNSLAAAVDFQALAAHLGQRIDPEDKAAKKAGKELDDAKTALVTALSQKVRSCAALSCAEPESLSLKENTQEALKQLAAWVDPAEAKHGRALAAAERAAGRPALALAALEAFIGQEEKPSKELFEERTALLTELQWLVWAEVGTRSLVTKFPAKYAAF